MLGVFPYIPMRSYLLFLLFSSLIVAEPRSRAADLSSSSSSDAGASSSKSIQPPSTSRLFFFQLDAYCVSIQTIDQKWHPTCAGANNGVWIYAPFTLYNDISMPNSTDQNHTTLSRQLAGRAKTKIHVTLDDLHDNTQLNLLTLHANGTFTTDQGNTIQNLTTINTNALAPSPWDYQQIVLAPALQRAKAMQPIQFINWDTDHCVTVLGRYIIEGQAPHVTFACGTKDAQNSVSVTISGPVVVYSFDPKDANNNATYIAPSCSVSIDTSQYNGTQLYWYENQLSDGSKPWQPETYSW